MWDNIQHLSIQCSKFVHFFFLPTPQNIGEYHISKIKDSPLGIKPLIFRLLITMTPAGLLSSLPRKT